MGFSIYQLKRGYLYLLVTGRAILGPGTMDGLDAIPALFLFVSHENNTTPVRIWVLTDDSFTDECP